MAKSFDPDTILKGLTADQKKWVAMTLLDQHMSHTERHILVRDLSSETQWHLLDSLLGHDSELLVLNSESQPLVPNIINRNLLYENLNNGPIPYFLEVEDWDEDDQDQQSEEEDQDEDEGYIMPQGGSTLIIHGKVNGLPVMVMFPEESMAFDRKKSKPNMGDIIQVLTGSIVGIKLDEMSDEESVIASHSELSTDYELYELSEDLWLKVEMVIHKVEGSSGIIDTQIILNTIFHDKTIVSKGEKSFEIVFYPAFQKFVTLTSSRN